MTRTPAPRPLTPALALAALALAVLALPAAAQDFDFGTVDLGEIDTQCFGICFNTQGGSGCDSSGTIGSLGADAPFYIRGLRLADVDDVCTAGGSNVPVTLPVTVPQGKILSIDVDLVATETGAQDGNIYLENQPVLTAGVNVLPAPPCPPSATDSLCLNDDRFTVRTHWRTPFGGTSSALRVTNVTSDDSGLFYFFNPNNWEILLKVLDGCGTNDHFWVFSAATTNVEYTITVTDTEDQKVSTYFNPLGHPAEPILDTGAFATCP